MATDLDAVAIAVRVLDSGALDRVASGSGRSLEQVATALRHLEVQLATRLVTPMEGSLTQVVPTAAGRLFLHRARRLLDEERQFVAAVSGKHRHDQLRVFASHYLAAYLLIDRIGAYRRQHPEIGVRLSVRTEQQIMGAMLQSSECSIGFCAPVDFPEDVDYTHWFDMSWSLVVPAGHRFAGGGPVRLADLVDEELILFEAGSTGRQHVLEAFHAAGARPRIGMQATTTAIIVQMVEAGLGISLLPLLDSGRVTAGKAVAVVPIRDSLQPIQSGIFVPAAWSGDPLVQDFVDYVRASRA